MRIYFAVLTALLCNCAARQATPTVPVHPTSPGQSSTSPPAQVSAREYDERENPYYKPPGTLFMHLRGRFGNAYVNQPAQETLSYYDGYHLYHDRAKGFTLCPLEFYTHMPESGTPAHHDEHNLSLGECLSLGKLRFYRKEAGQWHLLFDNEDNNQTVCSPRLTCKIAFSQDPESYGSCVSLPTRCVPLQMSNWPKLEDWNALPFDLF